MIAAGETQYLGAEGASFDRNSHVKKTEGNKSCCSLPFYCLSVSTGGSKNENINNIGIIDRGVKVGNGLYVIKHTTCPTVLVETAFISTSDPSYVKDVDCKPSRIVDNMYKHYIICSFK